MARETWVQSQVESYQRLKKWYLMPPCLTLSIIRYGSRVKWSNPGKGVAPSPTPWSSKLSKRESSGHPRLWSPTLLNRTLAKRLECSPIVLETWVRSQVESYQRLKKWYLMPPCLTLSIIRYGSRVKWSNPGKGVAPSPTPWCSKLSEREPSGHPRLWSPTIRNPS